MSDMVRLGAPDGRVAEVDGVTGRRYRATGGGMYEMHPRDAKAFKAEGAFVPTIGGVTRGGYACPNCDFRAVVRLCSRCGERCETDAERRARFLQLAEESYSAERRTRMVDDVAMEYEINTATGDVREVGPVRPAHSVLHVDPRFARAVLASESARRTIYSKGRI